MYRCIVKITAHAGTQGATLCALCLCFLSVIYLPVNVSSMFSDESESYIWTQRRFLHQLCSRVTVHAVNAILFENQRYKVVVFIYITGALETVIIVFFIIIIINLFLVSVSL